MVGTSTTLPLLLGRSSGSSPLGRGARRGGPVLASGSGSVPVGSGGASGGRGGGEGTSTSSCNLPVGVTSETWLGSGLLGTYLYVSMKAQRSVFGGFSSFLTWNLGLIGDLLVLLSLRITVEVQINHDVPLGLAVGDRAAQAEDLTGQHPPDQTDGVATLVVGGDGNVNELGGRVGVAEGDDGDVDIRGLLDGLGVGAGIGHDDQARLLEGTGDVVGEVTGGEASSDGHSTGVSGELQHGTLTVGTGRDHTDIGRVVDSGDDAGCEDDLLPGTVLEWKGTVYEKRMQLNAPGLANVDDIDSVRARLPQVRLHVHLEILGSQVALGGQEHLDVLGCGIENRGEVGGSHLDDLTARVSNAWGWDEMVVGWWWKS